MIMKQLFRHTTSLLRTALLLGAMILVNTQAKAQTAEQWAAMPDAFETVDPTTVDWSLQPYFYIQFNNGDIHSFLGEFGESNKLTAKDYIPFAKNILWTLEPTDTDGQYKLKSKNGYYVYSVSEAEPGHADRIHRYYRSSTTADPAIFTIAVSGNFFQIKEVGQTTCLGRDHGYEWGDIYDFALDSPHGIVRFARLKNNIAHIIYYREEGTENGQFRPNFVTTRHYLTYSGADYGQKGLINNGSMESNDNSSYYSPKSSTQSTITDNIGKDGSRGISVTSTGNEDNDWNTQFIIKANEIIPIGTKFRVEFDYRADQIVNGVPNQAQAQPGEYNHWDAIGSINFSTNWQHFSKEITVTADMGNGDGRNNSFQSIAICLGKKANTTFYFDNIVLTIPDNTEVSSRKSIIPKDKSLWTLPTIAAYHQDGLWDLVPTGVDGEFYIKKYGEEKYLTTSDDHKYGNASPNIYYTVLGDNNNFSKYILESPNANRYTRIKNNAPSNVWGYSRYLTHSDGDGWPVLERNSSNANDPDFWYAGFLPVEVPDTKKDEYYGVLLKVKPRKDNRIKLTRESNSQGNPVIQPLAGSTLEDLYGATFTPDRDYTNLFQIRNLPIGCYTNLVIEFEGAITSGWGISGIIDGVQTWKEMQAGITSYTMSLNGFSSIDDFTIFNVGEPNGSITIKACYFTPSEEPDYGKNEMLIHNGGTGTYSEEQAVRKLWKLEQIDPYDYSHFRLETPEGGYYRADGVVTDNAENAKIFTNTELLERFDLKWFYIEPTVKEIPVDKMITHRMSYLKQYAKPGLDKQGLATDADSDWWDNDKGTQKTNHFEITHYVRKGSTLTVEYPTVLNYNNDHIYYQRFYHYNDETCDAAYPDGTDINGLKNHVSLDVDGNVQYFLYKNGMVTGEKLKWDALDQGSYERKAQRRFKFTNSDGKNFTVAVDVSRYSDLTYESTDPLTSNLEEPSLTMRYIYIMRDAKVMAKDLTSYPEQSGVTDKTTWKEEGSVCVDEFKWMERKTFHFPAKPLPYENDKWAGYRGEFIGLRHVFSDYWVFADGDVNSTDDGNLVSAVTDNNGGKIEVKIYDPNNTGIRLGGWNPVLADNPGLKQNTTEGNDEDYQGFYFYDKVARNLKTQYGDSRFVVFRYPKDGDGKATAVTNTDKEAYIHVYLNNNGTRYQLAQFTIIFDKDTETIPWTSVNNSAQVKGSSREPKQLYDIAGDPIAKVTFDYPSGDTYHYPDKGVSRHDGGGDRPAGSTIANSSPIPLSFGHTNYAFDGNGANWGSYAMVSEKRTTWGNDKHILPADDGTPVSEGSRETYGYNRSADTGMQKAFLYIDASEQPGDICAIDFQGEFCERDQLMCSGWISGSNRYSDNGEYRCPGGITLTVKGEDSDGSKIAIYRFCPGQCYELDNGTGTDGSTDANHVVWQQFYFTFNTDKKYERYWLEVNNNCVSSNGGDFMLDNIEVYTIVPTVDPEINTPLCVKKDGTTEMRLLKLDVDYNRLKSSAPESSGDTPYLGFVFLDKMKFLTTFKSKMGLSEDLSLEQLADDIEKGKYDNIQGNDQRYKDAFDAALLGTKNIWKSTDSNLGANKGAGVMYFQWNKNFESIPQYSFYKAVNKQGATFRGTNKDGEPILILNGNYPELPWRTNVDYYIVPSNADYNTFCDDVYSAFNICSACTRTDEFKLDPPYTVLGLEKSEGTDDYVVCEGQIPTVALNLKGYDLNGNPVDMKGLNFDWWLGNNTASTAAGKLATLENYHKQHKEITYEDAEGSHTVDVKLDAALAALRSYYPTITSLDGVIEHLDKTPNLSEAQVLYLQEVVKDGQLVLHQSSISVPAEKNSDDDPYFYLVACPIHDAAFNQALNPQDHQYVGYFCDEPQGLRIKVGQKAPTLKTGFVPGEHSFDTYDYAFPAGTNPVLSIRLAKAAQFETVKNTAAEVANVKDKDTGVVTYNHSEAVNYLWLPIRNAMTQTADGVIKKSMDDNIYLASSNDPTWDKKISKEMSKFGSLPVVGRIVQLTAKNTRGQSDEDLKTNKTLQKDNRLCVYFTKDFDVREGYNYTLSLPFQENDNSNACDGTILINLKIVPDYEVWTGGAGNTDWNNDENWRRADGNTTISNDYYGDELYRANGAVNDPNSPLHDYTTNKANYYSSSNKENAKPSSDQILRKGFAPLYCTHILMKNDEWGNAPVLYDAIDGNENGLTAKPFPNLRDTSTPILKFDMQARRYDMWEETYGESSDRGESSRPYDLIAEMYQINSCDEIAMQPGTELLNAHLMNYNSAWMEYELDTKRWYLLGSPLQGTISGEWYAPTGTAQQKTTYYDNVTFGNGYDRYSPAIYQRSWDKAKAVLYEVGSKYDTTDDSQTANLGSDDEGIWSGEGNASTWTVEGGGSADQYLDRLGYKPMGGKKANVAIKGIWSNTYNDATVDYTKGGFSVMVLNNLKGGSNNDPAIVRLPKEDVSYKYWSFDKEDESGTDTNLEDVQQVLNRAKNRGRLKTDLLLPEIKDAQENLIIQKTEKTASRYGDQRSYTRIPIKEADLNTMNGETFLFTENVAAGASNLGYYLVENPFPCGLDMNAFFAANTGLQTKYWILTKGDGQNPRQVLVQQAPDGEWFTSDGTNYGTAIDYTDPDDNTQTLKFYTNAVVAPGQGFFVQATTPGESTTITFNKAMQVQSRFGVINGEGRTFKVVVGQSQKMRKLRKLVDKDGDGIPETESLETEDLGFETIEVDLDGDGIYGETGETEFVMVPVYETDGNGNYVLDGDGNKIPILDDIEEDVTIYKYKQETLNGTHNKEYPLLARTRGEVATSLPGLVITAQRGSDKTSALVMQREGASNDFLPSEDTETFICIDDQKQVPTVYTLCGRLATTINSIHDFRSLPIGVESNSDALCTLTFKGVEMLGDSISFYDALEQKLTPLESGMKVTVSGQTQNRYYIVRSLNQKEVAEETHLQIFTEGLTAKVIASTAEPITDVRCFDTAGRLIHSANPQTTEYSFSLPAKGIYIIEAQTDNDRKTVKLMAK